MVIGDVGMMPASLFWHENTEENRSMGTEHFLGLNDFGCGGLPIHSCLHHAIDGDTLLSERQPDHTP